MRVILLWALMYATAHNINYLFLKPTVHRDHHLHEDTNYGLDIADIIFDTKYDLTDIEDYNHISINLIVITAIMVYFFKDDVDVVVGNAILGFILIFFSLVFFVTGTGVSVVSIWS